MSLTRFFASAVTSVVLLIGLNLNVAAASAISSPTSEFNQMKKTFDDGNFKDAYEMFRKAALRAGEPAELVCQQLQLGSECLQRLNRTDEIDDFREAVVEAPCRRLAGSVGGSPQLHEYPT